MGVALIALLRGSPLSPVLAIAAVLLFSAEAHAAGSAPEQADPLALRTSSELFIAPDGAIFPVVDGHIEREEWSDAAVYHRTTELDDELTLYFKVVQLTGANGETTGNCAPYPGNPDFNLACGHYLFIGVASDYLDTIGFYIDEGDDGGYGSGSGDGVLTPDQEDFHEVNLGSLSSPLCYLRFGLSDNCPEPACSPWTGGGCWECVPNISDTAGDVCAWSTDSSQTAEPLYGDVHAAKDGYFTDGYYGGYWFKMYEGDDGGENSWGWMGFVGDNFLHAEFMLPFDGLDGSGCGSGCDVSDARFAWGDVLNIMFYQPTTFAGDYYPPGADTMEPATWVQLQIGGEAVDDGGCQPSSGRTSLAGMVPLALGLVVLSWARHRRGR